MFDSPIKRIALQVELESGEIVWVYSDDPSIDVVIHMDVDYVRDPWNFPLRAHATDRRTTIKIGPMRHYRYGATPPNWDGKELTDGNEVTVED